MPARVCCNGAAHAHRRPRLLNCPMLRNHLLLKPINRRTQRQSRPRGSPAPNQSNLFLPPVCRSLEHARCVASALVFPEADAECLLAIIRLGRGAQAQVLRLDPSSWCRGRGSNPHEGLTPQGILSPLRLPISPPRPSQSLPHVPRCRQPVLVSARASLSLCA